MRLQWRATPRLTGIHSQLPELVHRVNGSLWRRMEHNDSGASDAQHTAQPAKHVELLVEQNVGENGTEGREQGGWKDRVTRYPLDDRG